MSDSRLGHLHSNSIGVTKGKHLSLKRILSIAEGRARGQRVLFALIGEAVMHVPADVGDVRVRHRAHSFVYS